MPRLCRKFAVAFTLLCLQAALARPAAAQAGGSEPASSPAAEPTPGPQPAPAPEAPAEGPLEADEGGASGAASPEKGGVIGTIVVDGNLRVSDSAFFNNLKIKTGGPYDERAIRDEFRRLWDLDLFDEITVESRQRRPGTYDLIFHVRDRPLISNVAYVGMKAVTETNIQERLNQGKIEVRRGQPVDYSLLGRAETTIQQMLSEKGYLQARVRAKLIQVNAGQRDVTFYIREGGKTKIKKIHFTGNTVFKEARLKKMLKLTKEAFWLTSWASSKTLYHPAKFDQDADNIRTAYKSGGYLDIVVKPEVVELATDVKRRQKLERKGGGDVPARDDDAALEDDTPWDPEPPAPAPANETEKKRRVRVKKELKAKKAAEKTSKKWVLLTVPLEEGAQYRVGKLTMEGNTVFSDAEIMARLPLRPRSIFNDSALKAGAKRIEEDYGERGYFYVSVDPRIDKHDKVADLTLGITEDKKYAVDRIEFTGNSTTRDNVLRREMRLGEQQLFNVRQMRLGIRKIGQLGYFQVGDDPVVKPQGDEPKVDIEIQGTEANRNEIQVGGGVSGLEGGFFQGSYSTRNFLGKGEILSTFIQTGARANRYSINFTEPWFLGHPWTLGFSLFKRQTIYSGFTQNGSGGNVVLGRILGNFSRFDVSYGYEQVRFNTNQVGFTVNRTVSATSSISTIYTIDTRNNFFRPTRGARFQTSFEYAGGALGGDNYFWKPRFDATLYLPGLRRRHYIGLNASYGYVGAFGGRVVPTFERFFLGGERSLRVFRTRSVSPTRRDKDLNGNGRIDTPEDSNPDGIFEPCEDLNHNGVQDRNEPDRGNCRLDSSEDTNGNGILDSEDINHNGILDPGEDLNGNGILDTEDVNLNGRLDAGEDKPDGVWTPFCLSDDPNMNGIQDPGEVDRGDCKLGMGEDTNGDGAFGTVFPGGNQFVLLNAEYTIPVSDTVEFSMFYDAGNAFDNDQKITIDGLRVDYGLEMRFYLPIFQAPLRLIYGFIEHPQSGEQRSNFLFSIGTTF